MEPLNIHINDTINGSSGEFTVQDDTGRMILGEKPIAYLEDILNTISDNKEIEHSVIDTEYQTQVNTPIDAVTSEQLITASELAAHAAHDEQMFADLAAQIVAGQFTEEQIEDIVNAAIAVAGADVVTTGALSVALADYYKKTETYNNAQIESAISTASSQTLQQANTYTDNAISSLGNVATSDTLLDYYKKLDVDNMVSSVSSESINRDNALGQRIDGVEEQLANIPVLPPIDTVPIEDSENLVKSGGVYSAISTKSDIYIYQPTTEVVPLTKLKVGDDVSGSTLILPTGNSNTPGVMPYHAVDFSNGLYYGETSEGWGIFQDYSTLVYLALPRSSDTWNSEPYIMPENSFVTKVNDNGSLFFAVYGVTISRTSQKEVYDCEALFNIDMQDEAEFDEHRATDMARWNNESEAEKRTYILQAGLEGKRLSNNTTDITISSIGNISFTCKDDLGGLVSYTIMNDEDGTYSITYINNVLQPAIAQGLPANVPMNMYFSLNNGDNLSATKVIAATYTSYEEDPNSALSIINNLKSYTESEITDIISRMANDKSNNVDIPLNNTYGAITDISLTPEQVEKGVYVAGQMVWDSNGVGGIVQSIDGTGLMTVKTVVTNTTQKAESTIELNTEIGEITPLVTSDLNPSSGVHTGMLVWDSSGTIGYVSTYSLVNVEVTTISTSDEKGGITDAERNMIYSNADRITNIENKLIDLPTDPEYRVVSIMGFNAGDNHIITYIWAGDTSDKLFAQSLGVSRETPLLNTNGVYDSTSDLTTYAITVPMIDGMFESKGTSVLTSFTTDPTYTKLYYSYEYKLLVDEVRLNDVITPINNEISDLKENAVSTSDLDNYVKKTDIVVDSTPVENSTNFVTSGGVWEKDNEQDETMQTHRDTDVFRWNDTYSEQYKSIVRDAAGQGLKPESTAFSPTLYPYTVTSEYGAIFNIKLQNSLATDINVYYVNGEQVYSTAGLPPNRTLDKYIWVNKGDIITSNGGTALAAYQNLVPDTDSVFYQMVQQVNSNTLKNSALENSILDLKASIDNKILDPNPDNVVDITNISYTVVSSLGGRLTGIGYVLLGLLGVKVVSTGTVDVTYTNNVTVREYDNTSLLGVGEANPFSLDIDAGTLVVSSGMTSLTFTPYIPK